MNQLCSVTTEKGNFGFFRRENDKGYWVSTDSNLVTHLEYSNQLTIEAKEAGINPSVFLSPVKSKPISIGRSKKQSLGVKLF